MAAVICELLVLDLFLRATGAGSLSETCWCLLLRLVFLMWCGCMAAAVVFPESTGVATEVFLLEYVCVHSSSTNPGHRPKKTAEGKYQSQKAQENDDAMQSQDPKEYHDARIRSEQTPEGTYQSARVLSEQITQRRTTRVIACQAIRFSKRLYQAALIASEQTPELVHLKTKIPQIKEIIKSKICQQGIRSRI